MPSLRTRNKLRKNVRIRVYVQDTSTHGDTTFHNTSREEKEAIHQLSLNRDIIIKPADKGGAIVLQTYIDYDKECKRLLNDQRKYGILTEDPTESIRIRIATMVEEALSHNWVSKKEADFLIQKSEDTLLLYDTQDPQGSWETTWTPDCFGDRFNVRTIV